MVKNSNLLLAVLLAAMLLYSCKGQKPEPAGEEAEMAAEPEPVYDLAALARVLEGCSYVDNFKQGVATIRKDGQKYYIDKMGRFVDPVPQEEEPDQQAMEALLAPYEYHGEFSEGLCWISLDSEIGFINEQGEQVIPCQYEWAVEHSPCDFHEGVCPVMTVPERELFSYIDKTGQLAFPGYFSTESDFSEGLAGVRQFFLDGDDVTGTQPGYIDHTGKMILLLEENDHGFPFHDGVAKVSNWLENKAWFIDKSGNKLFDLDLERFYRNEDNCFSEGLCAIVDREGRWGFLDKTGRSTFNAQ